MSSTNTKNNNGDEPKFFSPVKSSNQQHTERRKKHYHNKQERENQPPRPREEIKEGYQYPTLTDEERENVVCPIDAFDELRDSGISEKIIRGIFSYGFEKPSPIQARSIRPIMTGMDVISQAQSGMGKTGAFCIGVLGRIEENKNAIQSIVLAHTRELALQIDTVFRQIATHTDIRVSLCVGGIPRRENIERISGKGRGGGIPHILIGTPGRIIDMMNTLDYATGEYVMDLSEIKTLVIDEADEMLGTTNKSYQRRGRRDEPEREQTGFLEQVKTIFTTLPGSVQLCLFSATMSKSFFDITRDLMRDPITILVKTEELTLDGIRQFYVNVEENQNKFPTLCALYSLLTISQSIIYCNTLKHVEILTNKLKDNDFVVSNIHGKMTPQQRELAMADFRSGKSRVLVSTDLLSRGIDVQQVSVVINYDIPDNIENYIHRIGRSGRFGRKGVAINFITNYNSNKIRTIQEYYSTMIDPLPADIERLLD